MRFPSAKQYVNLRRGITLIELLVATLIMLVAISGMVATWAQMTRTTLTSDRRGSAYEVAKQVMERTRSIGFWQTLPNATTQPVANGTYTSPMLARWRFFDEGLQEIEAYDQITTQKIVDGTINTPRPNAPAGSFYCVLTEVSYTPDSNRVADRPDLQLLAIQVTVYDASVANGPPLYQLQDALTSGGV